VKIVVIDNKVDRPDWDFEARDIMLIGYEKNDAIVQISNQNLIKKYQYPLKC